MTSNSMARLSEKLQQQLKSDHEAVSNQTSALLEQHASALRQLSASALSTTENVIKTQAAALEQSIATMSATAEKRFRLLMLWPVCISVFVSATTVLVGALIAWQQIKSAEFDVMKQHAELRRITQVIDEKTQQFCQSQAGRKNCKKLR